MPQQPVPSDVQEAGPQAVAIFRQAIANGESPRFAEMLAMRQAPRGRTDSTYFGWNGHHNLRHQWGDEADRIVADAQAHGYTPGQADLYDGGLARFPGDPNAFYSQTDGVDGVRKKYRKAGKPCEHLGVAAPEKPPILDRKIAPDIVREEVKERCAANPDLKHSVRTNRKKLRELEHQVAQEIAPKF